VSPFARFAFLDAAAPVAFAHRGGAATGVENALSAFAAVQRLGYRYVETDVRTTHDGVPVVFHDADTARLTGTAGQVGELTLDAVRRLALDGGEPVATLAEALHAFPGLRFNIDLKDAASVQRVPPVVLAAAALQRVCLTSFSERRVRQVRRVVGPAVCTGLGVGGVALLLGSAAARRPLTSGAGALQVPWLLARGRRLPERVVELGHRAGLAVHVWTVYDPLEMAAALDAGVDGIMTDQPQLLKDVLVARGCWS